MVDQFDKAGPIVVGAAGDAGAGNVIGAVTGDASLSKTVSTVDNIDTPQGQIATVLALNEQLVHGQDRPLRHRVERHVAAAEAALMRLSGPLAGRAAPRSGSARSPPGRRLARRSRALPGQPTSWNAPTSTAARSAWPAARRWPPRRP